MDPSEILALIVPERRAAKKAAGDIQQAAINIPKKPAKHSMIFYKNRE